jgi:predicted esterase
MPARLSFALLLTALLTGGSVRALSEDHPMPASEKTFDATCRLKGVPVWIFHGRKDDVIPVSWAEELGKRLHDAIVRTRLRLETRTGRTES